MLADAFCWQTSQRFKLFTSKLGYVYKTNTSKTSHARPAEIKKTYILVNSKKFHIYGIKYPQSFIILTSEAVAAILTLLDCPFIRSILPTTLMSSPTFTAEGSSPRQLNDHSYKQQKVN